MKPKQNGKKTPAEARNTAESKWKIQWLRRKLKRTTGFARQALIKELNEQERQLRNTPYYAKEQRHRSKIGYVRYADDFVIMVQGKKDEAHSQKGRDQKETPRNGASAQ